jgi:hypothetical protein
VDKVALGQVFLRVLRFPLPIFILPIAPQSPSSIIWGLYNRPEVAAVPSGLSLTPLIIIKKTVLHVGTPRNLPVKIGISWQDILYLSLCSVFKSGRDDMVQYVTLLEK